MNNYFGITSKSYNIIINTLINFPEVEKTVIFGSRAMENYKKGSDIDIAILGNNVTTETALNLSAILNEKTLIPYYFDIVCYKSLTNNDLKKHIDKYGKVLYTKSENKY